MSDSMNLAQEEVVCSGSVTGGTGAAKKIRGATVARTGAGVYPVTIDPNGMGTSLNVAEALCFAVPQGNVDARITVVHTSDTVKTVQTFIGAAGTAADCDFVFSFRRLLGG